MIFIKQYLITLTFIVIAVWVMPANTKRGTLSVLCTKLYKIGHLKKQYEGIYALDDLDDTGLEPDENVQDTKDDTNMTIREIELEDAIRREIELEDAIRRAIKIKDMLSKDKENMTIHAELLKDARIRYARIRDMTIDDKENMTIDDKEKIELEVNKLEDAIRRDKGNRTIHGIGLEDALIRVDKLKAELLKDMLSKDMTIDDMTIDEALIKIKNLETENRTTVLCAMNFDDMTIRVKKLEKEEINKLEGQIKNILSKIAENVELNAKISTTEDVDKVLLNLTLNFASYIKEIVLEATKEKIDKRITICPLVQDFCRARTESTNYIDFYKSIFDISVKT